MIEASIIIATYNRAERLRACLQALNRQTYPATDFEVVVVVDGSTDGTHAILEEFRPQYRLRVMDQTHGGQSAALNFGASAACGTICLFLDDDIIVVPGWLAEHLRLHRLHTNAVGIGQLGIRLPPGASWFASNFAKDWNEHYNELNQGKRLPGWTDCFGGNLSVPRSLFIQVGAWAVDVPRGFDLELAYRLEQSGCTFTYLPNALGIQDQPKDLRALVIDSEKSGRGCVDLLRRHPATLPILLGSFAEQRPRYAALLRATIAVGMGPECFIHLRWLLGKRIDDHVWYTLIQRHSFWRGVKRALASSDDWQRLTYGVPILMYHAFGECGTRPSRYVVPIQQFKSQMAFLKRWGYRVIALEDLLTYWRNYRLPPARSVVITIDDGYTDTALALNVLQRFKFPATTFVVSSKVGRVNDWDTTGTLAGRPLLSWAELEEIQNRGMSVGSHTCTHPDLTIQDGEQAQEEIKTSRCELEHRLGVPIRVFSYPFGKRTLALEEQAAEAGYWGSCSINKGCNTPATPMHRLRRVEIYGTDSILQFAHAVRFGARRPFWTDWTSRLSVQGPGNY